MLHQRDPLHAEGNRSFTRMPTGGSPPFTNEGAAFTDTPTVSRLPAGDYAVNTFDANECLQSINLTI